MTDLSIRPANPEDAPLVLSLLRELADYEKLLDRFHVSEDSIRRDMMGDPCNCDLGFVDGVAAGLVTSFRTYKSFRAKRGIFVEDLYVKPEFRGRGVGSNAMRQMIAWLSRHHVRRFYVDTTVGNKASQRMIQKAGFGEPLP